MRLSLLSTLCATLCATLIVTSPATAQITWSKPDAFWYPRAVPGGNIWLNVDAQHGVREPLFDHQRLAIELNLRAGTDFTPVTLPFADSSAAFVVKYDGSNAYIQVGAMAIEFIFNGQYWRCDLQIKWDWNKVPPTDYQCLPQRPAGETPGRLGRDSPSVASPDGQWVALISNHNVAIRRRDNEIAAPLSTDGTADFAYQPGSIRWAADSKSVTAYRVSEKVWLSESMSGNVKNLLLRGEWKVIPR